MQQTNDSTVICNTCNHYTCTCPPQGEDTNTWIKRHQHESPEYKKADRARYSAWKADFRLRFPTDEDVLDNIREKYRWPRFNKYSRAGKEEARLNPKPNWEKIQAALRLKEEEE